jgi:YidC/Oxa1 family membrane protein insertase
MSGLFGVPVDAAYHLVTTLSALLTPVAGGLAVAVAIAAFTVAVRLLVLPFSYYALRGQAAQARIAPQVQALRQRYAKQPDRLSRELKALYAENGTGLLAGCLPLLLQWPFLSVLYLLFRSTSIGGAPNELLTHHLFGALLGSHWLGGAGPLSAQGAVFAALFVLLGLCGWLAARAARRLSAPVPSGPGTIVPNKAQAAAAGTQPGQAAAVPPWLMSLMPYLTAVFAAFLPLAAGLYLLTTTAWTLLERSLLRRFLLPASPASPPASPASPPASAAPPAPVPAPRRAAPAPRPPVPRRPAARPASSSTSSTPRRKRPI